MKHLYTLLFLLIGLTASAQSPGRIFRGATPPATKPTNFNAADVWRDTASGTFYGWKSGWYVLSDQLEGDRGPAGLNGADGAKGDKGDKGDPGTCPPCPGGSGNPIDTEAELRAAITSNATSIEIGGNIGLTSPIDLPKSLTNSSKMLIIDLNGFRIFDNSAAGLPYLIGRKPANNAEATNVMQSQAFIIRDGCLAGKGATVTGTLIDLGATFNSVCENLRLESAKKGIHYKFCLMSTMRNCMSTSISEESFFVDRGDWADATNFNSQSNHTLVEQCRVFNRGGNFAAFRVQGCSGVILRQCISEGGNPQYAVYIDSQSSNVVKDVNIIGVHIESTCTVAGVHVRGSDMYAVIKDIYCQYAQVLFSFESTAGAVFAQIENVPWLLPATQFKISGNCAVDFSGRIYDCENIWAASRWVGGVVPSRGYSVCYGTGDKITTVK